MRLRAILVFMLLLLLGLGLWLWAALTPPSPLDGLEGGFTLRGVHLIHPGKGRLADVDMLIAAGKIEKIGPSLANAVAPEVSDLVGGYVLPGLIDMHAHLPPANALRLSGYVSFLYLSHGVTSIRDVGDGDGTSVSAARQGIEAGRFPGPRIFSCGPFVVGGGPLRWPNSRVLHDPSEADALAAEWRAAGHTCIKAYEDLSLLKLDALKAAAQRHGLQLLGHVPAALAYEEALLPDVQHFFGVPPPDSVRRDHILNRNADWHAVDDARLDLIVETTLRHDLINTPTLVSTQQLLLFGDYPAALRLPSVRLMPRLYPAVVWSPTDGLPFWRGIEAFLPRLEEALDKKKQLLRRLYDAGARLQLGTDAQQPFVVPGISLHQEMRLFAEAGIPLDEVWAMATWKAAGRMGVPGLGALQRGAPADFLVFARDPTADLDHLESLQAVVAGGVLYRRAELERARSEHQAHLGGRLFDAISIRAARSAVRSTVLRDY